MSSNVPVQQQQAVAREPPVNPGAALITDAFRRDWVPTGFNMYQLREFEEAKIDRALDREDLDELDRLCTIALQDANLPAIRRAKYEIISASCPGRDPVIHLDNAMRMMERCQQHINEGNGSDYSIELLGQLRESHRILTGMIVVGDGPPEGPSIPSTEGPGLTTMSSPTLQATVPAGAGEASSQVQSSEDIQEEEILEPARAPEEERSETARPPTEEVSDPARVRAPLDESSNPPVAQPALAEEYIYGGGQEDDDNNMEEDDGDDMEEDDREVERGTSPAATGEEQEETGRGDEGGN